jgi:hypothetical protein
MLFLDELLQFCLVIAMECQGYLDQFPAGTPAKILRAVDVS